MPLPLCHQFMRSALAVVLPLALTVALTAAPLSADAAIAGLETTETPVATIKQSRTLDLINRLLSDAHYHKRPVNDSFSSEVFDAYLKHLDPARHVFVQTDIDQFETLRYQFDDYIRSGALHSVFLIFDILRTRMDQRIEYALGRLDDPFDFDLDEEYRFDRKDAAWAADVGALDELWRKRIKNDILNLRLADKEEADIIDTLKQRYTHMARRVRQFNSEDVFAAFVNAYTRSIELNTSYYSPQESENFKIQMRLSLEGIGAVLQSDNEYTKVRSLIPGGPAELGRELKADDRITGVAQGDEEIVDVIGWRLSDIVELIRGPKASIVRLEILRGETDIDAKTKIISIQRDKINLEEQAAKKRVLPIETPRGVSTIGVIDLPSFYIDFDGKKKNLPDYRSTTRDVRKLLAEFKSEKIDGLVIDLRGNLGGSLAEAITMTGLFIEQGPVVQVRDGKGGVKIKRDTDSQLVYDGPLAVLVDRNSASASEIFAGAIQDYRRGLVIGEPSFGKGTVQHLIVLSDYVKNVGNLGRLKVTMEQFFRINGDSTQHRGVIPDIIWPTADTDKPDEPLGKNEIPWLQINQAAFRHYQDALSPTVLERTRQLHEARVRSSPEFQYYMGVKEINEQRRDSKSVTVNQSVRERERAEHNAQRLALENRKKRALGEAETASVELLDRENEAQAEAAEANPDQQEPDAFLLEGSHILSDYLHAMELSNAEAVARQNQPEPVAE